MPAYKYHLSDFKPYRSSQKYEPAKKLLLKMLLKRRQIYYFRWQLPKLLRPIISRKEFVKSLRTRDILVAKKRALQFEIKTREIIQLTDSFRSNELTEERFQEIVKILWSNLSTPLEEFNESSALMTKQEFANMCEEQIDLLKEKARWPIPLESRDWHEPRVMFRYALSLRLDEEFNITKVEPSIMEKLVDELFHIKIFEFQRMLDSLQAPEFKARIPEGITAPYAYANNPSKKMASSIWEMYTNVKKESGSWVTIKTIKGYHTQFSDFLEIIDGDLPITNVTREHALQALAGLKKFPAHRKKRYKDTPLSEIPSSADVISTNTVNQRLDILSGFFSWSMKRGHTSLNPFDGLRVKSQDKSYATYTENDIQELFNLATPRIRYSWQFWIPRIALYSGARQDEIASLKVTDIHIDNSDPIHYITITADDDRSVKSGAATRRVPIHPELIKHGLRSYVDQVKRSQSVSLWPTLTPKNGKLGQRVSEYWLALKTTHKIPSSPTNDIGERKVFHSLRRLAINQMKTSGIPVSHIQSVIGHEQSLLGETATYLDDLPLDQCLEAIKAIKHENIQWDHPKKYL